MPAQFNFSNAFLQGLISGQNTALRNRQIDNDREATSAQIKIQQSAEERLGKLADQQIKSLQSNILTQEIERRELKATLDAKIANDYFNRYTGNFLAGQGYDVDIKRDQRDTLKETFKDRIKQPGLVNLETEARTSNIDATTGLIGKQDEAQRLRNMVESQLTQTRINSVKTGLALQGEQLTAAKFGNVFTMNTIAGDIESKELQLQGLRREEAFGAFTDPLARKQALLQLKDIQRRDAYANDSIGHTLRQLEQRTALGDIGVEQAQLTFQDLIDEREGGEAAEKAVREAGVFDPTPPIKTSLLGYVKIGAKSLLGPIGIASAVNDIRERKRTDVRSSIDNIITPVIRVIQEFKQQGLEPGTRKFKLSGAVNTVRGALPEQEMLQAIRILVSDENLEEGERNAYIQVIKSFSVEYYGYDPVERIKLEQGGN